MNHLPDYQIKEKIAETRGAIIFRAMRTDSTATFILKQLKAVAPLPSEIARFKQEYKIIKGLNLDTVIRVHEIIVQDDAYFLVLEDFNGLSIKEILSTEGVYSVPEFLSLSATLAETLGDLHLLNIIHQDIRPHNILINQTDGRVKITDFGISTIITHEHEEIYNPDVIKRYLFYISPEQTGRMNREVDYRTDLYSLGVTFYEMLTGKVPFEGNDPLEIMHSHIAKMPVPVINIRSDIPQIISDIVMKLLSKNAEDRYVNSFGLLSDIKQCISLLEAGKNLIPFTLATKDFPNQFNMPQKLFGRNKEIAMLLCGFERICHSKKNSPETVEMIIVCGTPGIGKSTLINEVQKPIIARKGYFLSGKYEQLNKDQPYNAIIKAYKELIRQILGESREKIEKWGKKIKAVLGPNGNLMIDLFPQLELIIGPQPDLPELSPNEARNRFNLVFENFISAFSSIEHPVALFLDDLQWADLASLQLMEKLADSPHLNYLYLVGAYRDNEISDAHPLTETLDRMKKSGLRIERITLTELRFEDVMDLLINFLKSSREKAMELADIVYQKTKGNPFFVNEFLHTLYSEKLIQNNSATGWIWNIDEIRRMKVTENVVEFMATRIGKLPTDIQEILNVCACIGNRFELETIVRLSGKALDEVLSILTQAMQEGFIGMMGHQYLWMHDRIYEAAYSLIPEEKKAEIHYKIGKLLKQSLSPQEFSAQIFYISDHLNIGRNLIQDRKEQEELSELNLACGRKAKSSAAYNTALKYLETAIDLLETNSWQGQYNLSLAIFTESTESAYLAGEFDKMDQYAAFVLNAAKDIYDKLPIYEIILEAYYNRSEFTTGLTIALDVVGQLGCPFPADPSEEDQKKALASLSALISTDRIDDLIDLPEMADPHLKALLQILSILGNTAYFVSQKLFLLSVIKEAEISVKHGHCHAQSYHYIGIAMIYLTIFDDIEAGYNMANMTLKLNEKLKATRYRCRLLFIYYMSIDHWKNHLKKIGPEFFKAYHIGIETGDINYASLNLYLRDRTDFLCGKELTSLDVQMAKTHKIIRQLKQKLALMCHGISHQLVLNLLAKGQAVTELKGPATDQDKMLPIWEANKSNTLLVLFYSCRIFLRFLFGRYQEAVEDSETVYAYYESFKTITHERDIPFYTSLSKLAIFLKVPEDEQKMYLEYVDDTLKKFKKWAKHAPAVNEHRILILEAERARVTGDHGIAETKYERSVELSHKNDHLIDGAIACELATIYHLGHSNRRLAVSYITDAFHSYKKWGAKAKLEQMEANYSELFDNSSRYFLYDARGYTESNAPLNSRSIAISTVVKASQTLSGEVSFGRLLDKMMNIILENAGAQKGIIVLKDNGRLLVEAESTLEKGTIRLDVPLEMEEFKYISSSIVNYTARTKEVLILDNAAVENDFSADPYIQKNLPKSVLCLPIINQSELTGILYLENNISTSAFTPQRVEILKIISAQIAISIENAQLYENLEEKVRQRTRELQEARDALWGEMALAKKIQTVLLPTEPVITGYEIIGYMKPADEVGGDYYDVINCGDLTWIVIGDVAGHGVPAGLIMMMAQTSIHTVVKNFKNVKPHQLLEMVNKIISSNIKHLQESRYMTITVLLADENGCFYFSGLHQDILVNRSKTNNIESIETNGMWIGLTDSVKGMNQDDHFILDTNDTLFLYTDGITEATHKYDDHDFFGEDKLKEIFKNFVNGTINDIKEGLLHALEDYTLWDDVTFVIIRKKPG